jgi:hypothetical protein
MAAYHRQELASDRLLETVKAEALRVVASAGP